MQEAVIRSTEETVECTVPRVSPTYTCTQRVGVYEIYCYWGWRKCLILGCKYIFAYQNDFHVVKLRMQFVFYDTTVSIIIILHTIINICLY